MAIVGSAQGLLAQVTPGKKTGRPVHSNRRVSVAPRTDTVPVRPQIAGEPAEGYEVKSVTADPASVKIRGGKYTPELLVGIDTEPVDVSGRAESLETVASLRPPEGVTPYEASSVTVKVTIGPK